MTSEESLSVLEAAISQLDEGVIITDVAGRITFVNTAAVRLHGVARLGVPPKDYSDTYRLLTEDGAPHPSEELPLARAVLRGETVINARWRIRRPDGTEILAAGTARPLIGQDGRQVGSVLTLRDETAREAAEKAERERDALSLQLQDAFTQSPASTVIFNAQGRPLAVNPAFERLWGAAYDDVPSEYSVLTDPQLEAAGIMPTMRRVFGLDGARSADGAGEAASFPAVHYDVASAVGRGRSLWTRAHAYPIRDATGAVERVVLTHEDVTARYEAEVRLAESERQFHTLADAIPTLAWTAKADGFIDWYNRQWYEYTGTTPEQMEGWGWTVVHDPAVLPDVLERWGASISSGAPFEMTFPLRRADGAYRRFLTRVTPVRDAEERVIRWFGTNTDVEAERIARDAALSAASRTERLQALTASLGAARTLDDIANVVVAEGRAATGAESGVLALRVPDTDEVTIIRSEGLRSDTVGRYARFPISMAGPSAECIRTGMPIWLPSREHMLEKYPSLAGIWEEYGTQALASIPLSAGGMVAGAMTYMYMTPQAMTEGDRAFFLAMGRQAAQAVERAQLFSAERDARASAEAANKSKSDFLAAMSHEFRTPLNAIVGYAQLVELGVHGPVNTAQTESLGRIQRSGAHLLSLINDVLNFAKLEAGRVEYHIEVLRLADAVAAVAPMVEPQLAAKGLVYDVDIPADLVVRADGEKLQQIILNLLSNAIKFTDQGGRISVNAAHRGGSAANFVFLRVVDSGIGIPRDKQEAVFDPFIQVHRNLTRTTEGTGLGLAISRDLARGMGGELRVRSEEGHGSSFTVSLLRVPEPAADIQPVLRKP